MSDHIDELIEKHCAVNFHVDTLQQALHDEVRAVAEAAYNQGKEDLMPHSERAQNRAFFEGKREFARELLDRCELEIDLNKDLGHAYLKDVNTGIEFVMKKLREQVGE